MIEASISAKRDGKGIGGFTALLSEPEATDLPHDELVNRLARAMRQHLAMLKERDYTFGLVPIQEKTDAAD